MINFKLLKIVLYNRELDKTIYNLIEPFKNYDILQLAFLRFAVITV